MMPLDMGEFRENRQREGRWLRVHSFPHSMGMTGHIQAPAAVETR